MTKSALIGQLMRRFPQLTAKDVEYAVKLIRDAMLHALGSRNRIEIRGFGSFSLIMRPPRVGRNPKSGEKVLVPSKYRPRFKTGRELHDRIQGQAVGVLAPSGAMWSIASNENGERR